MKQGKAKPVQAQGDGPDRRGSDQPDPKPRSTKKRGKGRPANGGVGGEAIIASTRRLLTELPPSQITISSVAREAGVDPALVRYYFKDRATLLLETALAMIADIREPANMGHDPASFLRARVEGTFAFCHSAKYMNRLMIDELAASDNAAVRQRHRELNEAVVQRYRQALHGPGSPIREDADPFFIYLTLIAVFDFYAKAGPLIRNLLPPGKSEEEMAEDYKSFITDLLVNGLSSRA